MWNSNNNNNKSKCALINAPCPKTSDELAPVYCPNWVENIPEVEKDGTGRVTAQVFYTGCQLRRQILYMLSVTAGTGQAAASADKTAIVAEKCHQSVERLTSLAEQSMLIGTASRSLLGQTSDERDEKREELTLLR